MGQALYRKYRSRSLSEIVGQEHITRVLTQAIQTGRLSHAYLFTGPRGVGKTSIARILAHEINHLPYDDDQAHMDIIEIDAASNRRIDEIRDLRDKVYIAPTSAKYKVYIIDEVHMLTREAFNALLKTLEEPPAHVIFILATTDAHKLPETIVSRTQRFSFKPIDRDKAVTHLRTIARKEKIPITDDALELLADHGEGSFRDSISLLDQASSHEGEIDRETIQTLLGIPPHEALVSLQGALEAHKPTQVMQLLNDLYESGYQAAAIAKQLGQVFRNQLITQQNQLAPTDILRLLGRLIDVPSSHDPERFLEIILLGASTELTTPVSVAAPPFTPPPDTLPPNSHKAEAVTALEETPPKTEESPKKRPPKKAMKSMPREPVALDTSWPDILGALKQRYNTLYGIVRMAHPDFSEPGKLTLAFAFAFHQKRINDSKNRKLLTDTIEEITGHQFELVCVLDRDLATTKVTETPDPALSAISTIFGGGEVL